MRVAKKSDGWGLTQSLLETVFVRVGRHADVLPTVLSLLQRVATNSQTSVRAVVASLLQSLVPVLSGAQITSPVLPVLLSLSTDSAPAVVKAAVRALTSLYLEVSDPDSLARVNEEVASLLGRGPKDVIIEIMRALMRGIPRANPELRDGFMLDQVLSVASRVAEAAQAGAQELKDICAAIGDVGKAERAAAEQAAAAAREAAVQANAPWEGARLEDLEEVAMVTLECMRAFGSCLLPPGTRDRLLPVLRALLLDSDIVDASYRDMMVMTLTGMNLPVHDHSQDADADAGAGAGTGAGDHLYGATPAPSRSLADFAGTPTSVASDGGHSAPGSGVKSKADAGLSATVSPPVARSLGAALTSPASSHASARSASGLGQAAAPLPPPPADASAVTVMSLSSFSGPASPTALPTLAEATSPPEPPADGDGGEDDDGTGKKKFRSKVFGKIKGIRARAKARMTRKTKAGDDDVGGD